MLIFLSLAQFIALGAILITLIMVVRVKGQPRLKMLLASLYSFGVVLYLNDVRGMDLADKRGLGGNEPLIFGYWQLPIEIAIAIVILGIQVFFLVRLRKKLHNKR